MSETRLVAGFVAGLWFIASCGGVAPEVRTAYTAEVARCEAAEDAIVAREGTTEAQDRADLEATIAECDANLSRIRGQ